MRKRIVSVICAFLILVVPSATALGNDMPNMQEETTVCRDTDSVLMAICQNERGCMVFSGVYKDMPSVVYQWIGKVSEFQTFIPVENPFDYLEGIPFSELEGIETFDLSSYQHSAQATRDYSPYEARAVEDDMEARYGETYEWYPRYTESAKYKPLVFKIREDLMVSAEAMGLEALPAGITIASAAVSVAAWLGATIPATITWICNALAIYSATDALQESRAIQIYRGVSCTLRTSTVIASGGRETPLHTASRTYIRYYAFDDDANITSANASDAISDLGKFECTYEPSEYAFNVVTMVEDAYDLYIGN